MITIGIEAKPGSGKSTISQCLTEQRPDIKHIEVDCLVRQSRLLKLRDILLKYSTILAKTASSRSGKYTRKKSKTTDNIHNKLTTPTVCKIAVKVYFRIFKTRNRIL